MAICKDCVHYQACKGTYYTAKGDNSILYEFDGEMYAESGCEEFQNKADVETVVRCEKCTQWRRNIGFVNSPNGHCFYHCIDTNQYDFCSYGERKDENGRC